MLNKRSLFDCIQDAITSPGDYCRGWNDAVDAMPKWISVKERLPKADEVCIAVNRDGDIMIGHIRKVINGSCMCDDINSSEWIIKVTHWMPTPEIPKEA